MAGLTTHVLDTANGCPAAGLRIELHDAEGKVLRDVKTNDDGRCDSPLLSPDQAKAGRYSLIFYAGDYFRARGIALADPAFLDVVRIDFGLADPSAHYHVPLLIAPYGYSTYRGS